MMPDERLDQVVDAFREDDIPDGPPSEVVAETLAFLHRERLNSSPTSLLERIKTMPTFFRVAAAVLVATSVTGVVSVMTSNRNGPGVAFAEVIERVRATRTVTYTMRI